MDCAKVKIFGLGNFMFSVTLRQQLEDKWIFFITGSTMGLP